jgi:predicted phosphodiesterase
MLTAFVSDVHANLEALHAVMADIEERNPDRIVCLGDTINYGPNPVECLHTIRKAAFSLLGNHEEAVMGQPIGFNPHAAEAARWTRRQFVPSLFSDGVRWADWRFMRSLEVRRREGTVLLVHGSPRDPVGEYLLPHDGELILGDVSDKMTANFALIDHLCFVGHSHIPGVFVEGDGFTSPSELGHEYRIEDGQKAILNVGSVGQPRDHIVDASYATFDGEVVRWRRIPYDFATTCAKVKAIRGLPDRGGARLLVGE